MGVLQDLFAGNLPAVWHDITAGLQKLPAPLKTFITKVENDAENLLSNLASVAIKDVEAGGFTTASFIAAAKDVVAQALAQGQTILISDAVAMLNLFASEIIGASSASTTTSTSAPTTTDTGAAVGAAS